MLEPCVKGRLANAFEFWEKDLEAPPFVMDIIRQGCNRFRKAWFSYVGKIPDDQVFYFLPTIPDFSPSVLNGFHFYFSLPGSGSREYLSPLS